MALPKPSHPPLPPATGTSAQVRRSRIALVVRAVATVLPDVDPEVVAGCVEQVCPPGTTVAVLARQVVDEPALLVSGSSRSTGEVRRFITALRKAGNDDVVTPRCEACGRAVALMSRLPNGGMLCESCWRAARPREPCTNCGRVSYPGGRTPAGGAVCGECMRRRHSQPCGQCGRRSGPHGRRADGAPLCQPCARRRREATCQDCGALFLPTAAGQAQAQVCGPCWRAKQHQPCAQCGQRFAPAGQRTDGASLCGRCWQRYLWTACAACGRKTPRPREQDGGLVCLRCYRRPSTPACVRCKRSTRSGAEGGQGLVCPPCWRWLRLSDEEQAAVIARRKRQYQASKHRCDRCGRTAVISVRRAEESVCKTCATRPQVVCAACGMPRTSRRNIHDRSCPRCGDTQLCTCPVCGGQRFGLTIADGPQRCLPCRLRPQLIEALTGGTGHLQPALASFVDRLAEAEDHQQVRRWLRQPIGAELLAPMAQGRLPVTHQSMDTYAGDIRAQASGVEHLRRLLVAAGCLPRREEHLTRLEREIQARLALMHPEDRAVMRRYVTWYTLPRTRRRLSQGRDPDTTCAQARNSLTGPTRLLSDIRGRGVQLASLSQADVEAWIADNPGYLIMTAIFLRWARAQRLAPAVEMRQPATKAPTDFVDPDRQWATARRLLTDPSLSHRLRLVGALVLLYGQTAASIARLRQRDILTRDGQTSIRLGRDEIVLDEALATIATALASAAVPDTQARGLSQAFNATSDGWLFPGRGPGKPLGVAAHRNDLARLGIRTRAGRNTALLALARDVPPSVLCDLLGVSATTAERWRQYAGGTWSAYAADTLRQKDRRGAATADTLRQQSQQGRPDEPGPPREGGQT